MRILASPEESLSLSHWFKIEPQSDKGLMREATVALELISGMKSAMTVESNDSFLSLYLTDTLLAFNSTRLHF